MATLTYTGNADQIRAALNAAAATLTMSGRSATIIFDDTPGTGNVVKVTGADGTVRQY
jgi:hypothetical protein